MRLREEYKATRKPNDNFIWWFYRKCMGHIPVYVKYHQYMINEHRKSFGKEHPDKTFYIIRPNGKSCGLMSLVSTILLGMRYAESKGYIPVIDFSSYPNMYRDKKLIHENSFEYYYKQPYVSLKEIKKAKNVVIASMHQKDFNDNYDLSAIKEMNKYLKMIEYSDSATKYIEDEYSSIVGNLNIKNPKILGVLGRGTDYSSLKPHKHNIVPTASELIEKAEELIIEWGEFDYIFLATEDNSILDEFKNHFGERLLYNKQERYSSDTKGKALSQIHKKRKQDHYYRGLEYLSTIDLLSKCDSLITSDVGGARIAAWKNDGKYNNLYVFNLGKYE